MWVDYRGPLSTVYNYGEISTCGKIIEVHSVQSTMMGGSQHVGRLEVHSVQSTMMGRSQHVGRLEVHSVQSTMMGRSQHVGRL